MCDRSNWCAITVCELQWKSEQLEPFWKPRETGKILEDEPISAEQCMVDLEALGFIGYSVVGRCRIDIQCVDRQIIPLVDTKLGCLRGQKRMVEIRFGPPVFVPTGLDDEEVGIGFGERCRSDWRPWVEPAAVGPNRIESEPLDVDRINILVVSQSPLEFSSN